MAAPEPPPSTDATLRSLTLSGVTLDFDPATTTYTAQVGNDLAETTVTPTGESPRGNLRCQARRRS